MKLRKLLVPAAISIAASFFLYACSGNDKPPLDSSAVAVWNSAALKAVADFGAANPPGFAPMQDSRIYAMAFTAMHDALNAIDRRYQPYLSDLSAPKANPDAAVAQAVHDVMVHEVPSETAALDTQLTTTLASIADGDAKTRGISLGQQTAAAIVAARAGDGSVSGPAPGYVPASNDPGVYQPTAPIGVALFVTWGQVTPFALTSATQFRAPPDYAVTDAAYAADFNEIKAIGGAVSATRTADQSEIARFWLENTPDGWDRIASTVATARTINGWDRARLLATMEIALADSYIEVLNDKYFYHFWRPLTAITSTADDGNPDTTPDTSWTPFDPVTPPVPDYPSAHADGGAAAAAVLSAFFGSDAIGFSTTSGSLPGVTRSFTSFTQAARENADSRIFVGYHFRHATDVGVTQGQQVGAYVFANRLRPVN